MKSKKVISMTLAAALTLSLATTSLATNIPAGGGVGPTDAEREANGNTTISIMQAKVDPSNVSFTVPLYVTMAVVENDAAVKVPDNYAIANTTPSDLGAAEHTKIGVTAMSFEKLEDSTFNTVADTASVAANTDIHLTIGGMDMPALSTATVSAVTLGGALGTAADPTEIAAGATQALAITGAVTSAERDEASAVAQFRVKYTISLLSSTGEPLGAVYAGDDRTAAGLGEFNP